MDYSDSSTFSTASGKDYQYVVLQVTLKEKFLRTGSGNLTELEEAINHQAQKGCRLHTITTSSAYRVKRCPLLSSSLSSSFSIMLLSNGDKFPPCGVPTSVASYMPLFITPALRYFLIRLSVSPSCIILPT